MDGVVWWCMDSAHQFQQDWNIHKQGQECRQGAGQVHVCSVISGAQSCLKPVLSQYVVLHVISDILLMSSPAQQPEQAWLQAGT